MDARLSSPVPDLDGKTVFITGAGSGMGEAIAAAVLEKGGNVFSLEINPKNIETATEKLAGGDRLAWHEGSVAVKADVEAAFAAAVERFGEIHHLVNNAGIADMGLVKDMSEAQWDAMVDTLLKGAFLCSQAFAQHAIPNGAGRSIVNISSLNAVAVTDGMAHYCAAKAGVKVFGEVCAAEFGAYGIRVNSIGPGTTVTPMSVYARMGRMGQEFLDRTLIQPPRHQEASDIADVALFLMSPAAQRITGHFVPVDGGQHVRGLHNYHEAMAELFASGAPTA
jgi:3-oxoacyl-[acyl-carrier protein] reductase